ncbi:hypothetical protein LuPra_01376 [Luteitalea pratensis]|uniref:Uncharacterized protein n=1 Tax=Luteitalea pratensis TaxID=1855912 RepID=A0A143PK91_LUTPR|nr:hypothetical protein [Luteitalea pratensis]AMY08184.1 hypothetical protein LuPra_01376 [Luteitalea pratensis]
MEITANTVGVQLANMLRLGALMLLCLAMSVTCARVLRPGMNSDCAWPPETVDVLDLSNAADARHLVVDAELIDELVDRYRFHPTVEQRRQCETRLVATVAHVHGLGVGDVAQARLRVFDRGLNLPVILPMVAMFIGSARRVTRWIQERFGEDPLMRVVSLSVASIGLSGSFVLVGELWTSVLQMIRVGSQHVGGRVDRLPWLQHQPLIFVLGLGLFWVVYSVTLAAARGRQDPRAAERSH